MCVHDAFLSKSLSGRQLGGKRAVIRTLTNEGQKLVSRLCQKFEMFLFSIVRPGVSLFIIHKFKLEREKRKFCLRILFAFGVFDEVLVLY